MSNASSSAAAWYTRLEPVAPPEAPRRPDDPRLGECVEFWCKGPPALRAGRPVLVGFPQDEGVRRNQGRPGAAAAPAAIRHWLYRLTPWDAAKSANLAALDLLDLGDVQIAGDLEESQQALAEVIAAIVTAGSVPIVLGGGHETAYGHYLGYVRAGREVAIINLDAHLDVRPLVDGQGHSGSPFRQALEHPTQPLRGDRYVCLGAQPFAVNQEHQAYVQGKGGVIRWASRPNVRQLLGNLFLRESERLSTGGCPVYVTLDSDVVQQTDVPGVSAPNPLGLYGRSVAACAAVAGEHPAVSSFDLVEINPSFDRDGQSARWAAVTIWHFLSGLTRRSN
ncbi:MAG TPA: formimidoylglutamase [Gemmataceae bacterium]|jgi:formiminoglutamase